METVITARSWVRGIRRMLKNLPFKLCEQVLNRSWRSRRAITWDNSIYFTKPELSHQMVASNFINIFSSSCTINGFTLGHVLTKQNILLVQRNCSLTLYDVTFTFLCDLSIGAQSAHQCILCCLVSRVKWCNHVLTPITILPNNSSPFFQIFVELFKTNCSDFQNWHTWYSSNIPFSLHSTLPSQISTVFSYSKTKLPYFWCIIITFCVPQVQTYITFRMIFVCIQYQIRDFYLLSRLLFFNLQNMSMVQYFYVINIID